MLKIFEYYNFKIHLSKGDDTYVGCNGTPNEEVIKSNRKGEHSS